MLPGVKCLVYTLFQPFVSIRAKNAQRACTLCFCIAPAIWKVRTAMGGNAHPSPADQEYAGKRKPLFLPRILLCLLKQ